MFSQIDCTSDKSVCSHHGVSGYPTLLYFHNGEKVDTYNGARDENAIEAYIKSQISLLDGLASDSATDEVGHMISNDDGTSSE